MVQGFIPGRSKRFFFFPTHPEQLLDPPSILFRGYRHFFLTVKQLRHEVYRSPPYSAKVKNEWSYIPLLSIYALMAWTETTLPFIKLNYRVQCKRNNELV
jgi:hypothetical protein